MVVDTILVSVVLFFVSLLAPIGTVSPALVALSAAVVTTLVARETGVYGHGASDWRLLAWRRTAVAVGGSSGLFLLTAYVTQVDHDRTWLPLAAASAFVVLIARSALVAALATRPSTQAVVASRVALMGTAEGIAQFDALERKDPHQRIVERVVLDDTEDVRAALRKADQVVALANGDIIDRVVVLAPAPGMPVVNAVVRRCGLNGLGADLLTGATRIRSSRLEMGRMHGFSTVHVHPGLHGPMRQISKRAFDFVVASVLLVVFSPVFIGTAAAVAFESRGSVFYKQRRLGQGGRQFEMIKFRSMVENADQMIIDLSEQNDADGPLFKMKDDPRVTKVGRIIRRTSIDELPQLWNVVKGEMSLVGPRPALPREADGWPVELFDRLSAAPGITGLWQVTGRSDATFADYERLDLYYVDNWTFGLDLRILLSTLPALLGRGAY